jgi:transmembrane sensor
MTTPGLATSTQSHDAIARRAADFLERRRFGGWSDTDQIALDAWLAESDFHQVAWLRLEGSIAHVEKLAALRPSGPKSNRAARDSDGKRNYRRFVLPLLAAASIALFAALGIPFVNSLLQPPDRSFSTDIGGRSTVRFADGTEIELNTDTAMRFRMTTAERTVWLEKGEAWFRVAHNAANPFTVVIGRHRVTDLGTEFFVRRGSEGMEVALLNGRAMLNTEGALTTLLAPGDDALATPVSVSVTRKTPKELADALAWRRGVLVFRNTKLSDVVREFNRYNQTRLVIADPSIADVKIYAELKTDDFGAFLNLAQTVLNLCVDHEGNDILISRGPRDETKRAARTKHGL